MAISFKSDKDYGYSLLPLFGVSPQLINEAKAAGIVFEQNNPGTFLVQYAGTTYGSVSVKGTAISLAKSKTLGPASKEALKFQFEGGIKKALVAAGGAPKMVFSDIEKLEANVKAHLASQSAGASPIKFTKASNLFGTPVPSGTKFSKDNPVSLSNATKIYTPVNGTTAGSVYFVLAMYAGLNVAARIQGSKLSIRAEGLGLTNYSEALTSMGLDMKSGYSSGHFEVESKGLMVKTLGALIGSIGIGKSTDIADIQQFIGGQ